IIDRGRTLEAQLATSPPDRAAKFQVELATHSPRAQLIARAITLCTVTAPLVRTVSATLFLRPSARFDASVPVPPVFVAARPAVTAERLGRAPVPSDAAALDSVERRFFALAPLVAACPRYLRDYVRLSGRLREAIKWQSRRWDVAGDGARVRLYRSLYGFRGAVEEAMLQHPDTSLSLLEGRREPSATPAATVHGVDIHSGDILVA